MFIHDILSQNGITCILTLVIAFCIWKMLKVPTYWKEKGIIHVKPVPLFGTALAGLLKPIHEVEYERHQKYGPIYGHYEGMNPALNVADPALLRRILVKDFTAFHDRRIISSGNPISDNFANVVHGESWKRIRTLVSPLFTIGRIKKLMHVYKGCADSLVHNIKEAAEAGVPVNIKRFFTAFALDVIASSSFSVKLDSHNDPNNKFVVNMNAAFQTNNWKFALHKLLLPRWKKIMNPMIPNEVIDFFASVTLQILEERKKTGKRENDLLQVLIDCHEGQSVEEKEPQKKEEMLSNYAEDESSDKSEGFKSYKGKKLTYDEMIAQCVINFLGGVETTASTLVFTAYYLAFHEDIQKKLIDEVDETLRNYEGKLTYEAIQSMKFLDNVISEALRINPPATRLARTTTREYEFPDTGITVPKGTVITVPVFALHRDPKYFPNPEKFDPDRFSPEERAKRDPFTYMPFGLGPRQCFGMAFALVEAKVCMANVMSNFVIKRCPETKEKLEYYIGQAHLQPKEVYVKFEKRKDSPLKN